MFLTASKSVQKCHWLVSENVEINDAEEIAQILPEIIM